MLHISIVFDTLLQHTLNVAGYAAFYLLLRALVKLNAMAFKRARKKKHKGEMFGSIASSAFRESRTGMRVH
jgi:hypothetical protein